MPLSAELTVVDASYQIKAGVTHGMGNQILFGPTGRRAWQRHSV
jgi:hypothetical protein